MRNRRLLHRPFGASPCDVINRVSRCLGDQNQRRPRVVTRKFSLGGHIGATRRVLGGELLLLRRRCVTAPSKVRHERSPQKERERMVKSKINSAVHTKEVASCHKPERRAPLYILYRVTTVKIWHKLSCLVLTLPIDCIVHACVVL